MKRLPRAAPLRLNLPTGFFGMFVLLGMVLLFLVGLSLVVESIKAQGLSVARFFKFGIGLSLMGLILFRGRQFVRRS